MSILGTLVTAGCTLLGTVIGLASQPIIKKIENSQLEKQEKRKDLINRTETYISSCSAVYQANKEIIQNYYSYTVVNGPRDFLGDEAKRSHQFHEGLAASEKKIGDAKATATLNMVILKAEMSKLEEPLTKLMKAADFIQTKEIDLDTDINDDLVKKADARYQEAAAEVADTLRKSIK